MIPRDSDRLPDLPAECRLEFRLQPAQYFGASTRGGTLAYQSKAASCSYHDLTGCYESELNEEWFKEVRLDLSVYGASFSLKGNKLIVRFKSTSYEQIHQYCNAIYYYLTQIMSIRSPQAVYADEFSGYLNDTEFGWGVHPFTMNLLITTREEHVCSIQDS
ncbi:MAG: hypothetical protein RIG82_13655 [Phycisphaeraceae bacterium]